MAMCLFNAPVAQNIAVNNTGGTIQGLMQRDYRISRDSTYNGSANLNLTGGDYLSQALNLNSGTGVVNANIGKVTGVVNTTARRFSILVQQQPI